MKGNTSVNLFDFQIKGVLLTHWRYYFHLSLTELTFNLEKSGYWIKQQLRIEGSFKEKNRNVRSSKVLSLLITETLQKI